jgi:predicted DNA-binding helix-hairpin-helix protein
LENQAPGSPTREQRLYQASFLLRDYGFTLEELPFGQTQNLPLEVDPKLAWARAHLSENPIEINRADRQELLRIPGIGIKGANAILEARRVQMLNDLSSLFKLGIQTKRAAPFILLDGKRPNYQLDFW